MGGVLGGAELVTFGGPAQVVTRWPGPRSGRSLAPASRPKPSSRSIGTFRGSGTGRAGPSRSCRRGGRRGVYNASGRARLGVVRARRARGPQRRDQVARCGGADGRRVWRRPARHLQQLPWNREGERLRQVARLGFTLAELSGSCFTESYGAARPTKTFPPSCLPVDSLSSR